MQMHNMIAIVHINLKFSAFYLRNCQKVTYFANVFEKKRIDISFIN